MRAGLPAPVGFEHLPRGKAHFTRLIRPICQRCEVRQLILGILRDVTRFAVRDHGRQIANWAYYGWN